MRFLEVNFYGKADTSDTDCISVVIRWRERAGRKKDTPPVAMLSMGEQSDQAVGIVKHSEAKPSRSRPVSASHSNDRLRPTDRLVLNALRARVIPGEQVTRLVRLQELMDECAISRRQVQICLRRLTERGLVNRLLNEGKLDNQEGFAYKISQGVL